MGREMGADKPALSRLDAHPRVNRTRAQDPRTAACQCARGEICCPFGDGSGDALTRYAGEALAAPCAQIVWPAIMRPMCIRACVDIRPGAVPQLISDRRGAWRGGVALCPRIFPSSGQPAPPYF